MTWIEQTQRNRDGRLWLELSEFDIADWATVVSIDECPAEIEGEGRLVTGRFEHSSAEVLNLYVEGEQTPIGTTASHPFWSQDRQAFVSAELLRTTERLRLEDGRTAAVIRIEQLPGTQSVYNLEVDGEHVYHVGLHGVLVHNSCGNAPKGLPAVKKGVNSGIQHAADQAVNKGIVGAANRANVLEQLRALTKSLKNGFPKGSVPDPGNVIPRADSVLVPFRDGAAVFEVGKNGTARLQTLLNAAEFATALKKLGL